LIRASYKLTLNEQRLILTCIAKIDSQRTGIIQEVKSEKILKFRVTAAEFCETFKIDMNDAYAALKEATKKLYEQTIRTVAKRKDRYGVETQTVTEQRWIISRKYEDGAGYAEITFNPEISGHLTMLGRQFTSYQLNQIAGFKSIYAIRLFELLMQYRSTGTLRIEIEKIIELFQLSYKFYNDVRRFVIEPAVKELLKKGNMTIEWTPIKHGKTVKYLDFKFKEDETRSPL
jgi:plasmid replication initiation protein